MTDWKIPIFNRKYIFKWWIFHCHVSFRGGNKANVGENVPYETAIWGEGESVTSDVMYISLNILTNHRFAVDALKMVFLTVMNPMAKKKYHTVIHYVKCVTFKMMISSSSIYPPNPSIQPIQHPTHQSLNTKHNLHVPLVPCAMFFLCRAFRCSNN